MQTKKIATSKWNFFLKDCKNSCFKKILLKIGMWIKQFVAIQRPDQPHVNLTKRLTIIILGSEHLLLSEEVGDFVENNTEVLRPPKAGQMKLWGGAFFIALTPEIRVFSRSCLIYRDKK